MRHNFSRAAILSVVAVSTSSALSAYIDDFTEGNESLFITGGTTGASATFTDVSAPYSVPLGDRTRFTQIAFAPGMGSGAAFSARLNSSTGEMAFANTSNAWAVFTERYGDNGTLDLTSNSSGPSFDAIGVTFSGIAFNTDPLGSGLSVWGIGIPTLTVTATDTGGNTSAVQKYLYNGHGATYSFAHSLFDSSVNFSSIDSLTFRIDSNIEGASFTLDQISQFTVSAVPEPASLACLAVVGLTLFRRR